MRSLIKTIKALQVELKVPREGSRRLLPIVQHALNMTPSSRLGGRAPVTIMTQLPATNALTCILYDATIYEADQDQLDKWREANIVALAASRDALHRETAASSEAKRDKQRKTANLKKNRITLALAVGDYVLVGLVSSQMPPKLTIQWLGPRRIIEALSDWVYIVEDLRDRRRSTHHISRLKLFATADLHVSQDLLDHVAYVEGGHVVEALLDCKYDRQAKEWQILVKWMGIDEFENSWEPLSILYEDVPTLVIKMVATMSRSNSNVKKMSAAVAALQNVI